MKSPTLQEEQLMRQAKARSLTERAPWLFSLDERVIANKDSALMACFEFDGPDVTSSTISDVNSLALRAQNALRILSGRPVNMWWTVRRRRTRTYRSVTMPDAITQLIDDRQRDVFTAGKVYTNRHYLSISLLPVSGSSRFFERLHFFLTEEQMSPAKAILYAGRAMFKARDSFAYAAASLDTVISRLDQLTKDFQSSLPECQFRRLEGDELRAFLMTSIPRADSDITEVAPPLEGQMLDGYLVDQTWYNGHNYVIFENGHKHYVSALAIKPRGYPSGAKDIGGTQVGMLQDLLKIDGEITVSQCFRFATREEQEKHINEMRRYNEITKLSSKQWVGLAFTRKDGTQPPAKSKNSTKEGFTKEAEAALADITAGEVSYGWHNLTVLAHGRSADECERVLDEVDIKLRSKAMIPVRETIHLDSSIGGTIPGQWADIAHWHFLSTANMADLALLNTQYKGKPINTYLSKQMGSICRALATLQTEEKTEFYLNTHYEDLAHMFVAGPSRTGKTVLCNFMWTRFRQYPNANVIILDRDYSCRIPTLLQGGQHVTVESDPDKRHDKGIKFGPVVALLGQREHWEWLADWIRLLMEMNGYSFTSADVKSVWATMEETARLENRALWRLNTIHTGLPPHLKEHLAPWVGQGQYAHYFDNAVDAFALGKLTCIEMSDIIANKRVAAPFLLYIFMRVDSSLAFGQGGAPAPTMIYAEECSFLLLDPIVSPQLRKWAATLAKRLTTLMLTTQSIEDFEESTIFAALRDNFPTRCYLPNKNAATGSLRELYHSQFNLNDKEIDLISKAVPKQDYMMVNPDGTTMVRLPLDEESVACLRSDKLAQTIFDRHWNNGQNKDGWQQDYIADLIETEKRNQQRNGAEHAT